MTRPAFDAFQRFVRDDFHAFIIGAFAELNPHTEFHDNWHIELIAAKLEAVRRGECRRLIITVPPRSLKSHCASVAFPAWLFGHNPGAQIISVSYAQDLADKLARDSRALMASRFYRSKFATRLSSQKHATAEYETTAKGFRLSTSVGGVLTGRGADFIIIDDALKPDEALSDAQRAGVNAWYQNTLLSRLNSKVTGAVTLVMQRVHEDDLAAFVQQLEPGLWEVLSLPAIAERDEVYEISTPHGVRRFGRKAGKALHPGHEPLETLEHIRGAIGSYNFAAQYQQSPAPAGGGLVKEEWFRSYDPHQLPAKFDRVVQSWDTANKETELSDFSVCTTWGMKDERIYLLSVLRHRFNYPDLKRAVYQQAQLSSARIILIEDRASGTQLIQELVATGLSGVTPCNPERDKVMRMHAQTALIEAGYVFLPREAHWRDPYLHEIATFPKGKYDDQVDSTSQALEWMQKAKLNSAQGWVEFYAEMARKALGLPDLRPPIRVKKPADKPDHFYLAAKRWTVDPDGTIELPAELARILIRNGWTRVEPPSSSEEAADPAA